MKTSILLSLWLRSLSIQASFNERTLQGLGFLYALLPLLDSGKAAPDQRAAGLNRHGQRFNTHPFLVPAVLGAVARLEEEGAAQEAVAIKGALMGPYAAIGDVFFWGGLRVLAACLAVLVALLGFWGAPLGVLLLHNPAQWWVRGWGFVGGYRWGRQGVAAIQGLDLPETARRIRWLSLLLLGIMAAVAAAGLFLPWGAEPGIVNPVAGLALTVGYWAGLRQGISQLKLLYGTALLCVMMAI